MKRWFYILILMLLAVNLQAQEATAVLKNSSIKIGEQTEIQLELRFTAGQKVMLPNLQDTITKFIEVVRVSDLDTTFDEEDISIQLITQTITITSWDSGFHAIPPFTFKVGKDTIKSQANLLEVKSVALEAEADIKDIKQHLEVPFSLSDWLLAHKLELGLSLLAVLLLVIGILLYLRYRKKPKTEAIEVPKEAADVLALKQLEALEQKALWQNGQVKEYYVSLSFILREYIGNRYQLHALEHTTVEIMLLAERLPKLNKELKEKLKETLLLADLAKFAKQKPLASENEKAIKHAFTIVKETAFVEEESVEENEEVSPQKQDA